MGEENDVIMRTGDELDEISPISPTGTRGNAPRTSGDRHDGTPTARKCTC